MQLSTLTSPKLVFGLLFLFLTITFFSCSKGGSTNPAPQPTSGITSLSVNQGVYTTPVSITGSGFSASIADEQVFFNGKAAVITSATATQITTTVPLGAGTGTVTVKLKDGTVLTGPLFTYQLSLVVTTLAGSGKFGFTNGADSLATFNVPEGIAVDRAGNVFVSEELNNSIRKISTTGIVSMLAGTGSIGSTNGPGVSASFYHPWGLAVDNSENVYVADYANNRIRKIDNKGVVTTFAGNGSIGYNDGIGTIASVNGPTSVAVDNAGSVYVADFGNNLIRKITPDGNVTTLAGVVNGVVIPEDFNFPYSVTVDGSGNVYVIDLGKYLIKKVTPSGFITTIAGSGVKGTANGIGTAASFDGSVASDAIDKHGNLYITDGNLIRKIDPNGVVSNFAGKGTAGFTNGPLAKATFGFLSGIAIDNNDNIYLVDNGNNVIRKISMQ